MIKEYKPVTEYFTFAFLFLFFFVFYCLMVKFEWVNMLIFIPLLLVFILDTSSRRNFIVLNDKELVIEKKLLKFSKITTIELRRIKSITLKSPAKVRGVKVNFINGDYKIFLSGLSKSDLMMLGNDFKLLTSIDVYIEKYFKTEKL